MLINIQTPLLSLKSFSVKLALFSSTCIVLTGGSSGIGAETARVLALRGAHVVLGVRNVSAGNYTKEAIVKQIPTAKVDVLELDLSSMSSVKMFVSEFKSSRLPLNVLM